MSNFLTKVKFKNLPLIFSYGFIVISAFVLRVWEIFSFNKLIFDEKYYVKDGYSVLKYGYEAQWVSEYNKHGTPEWEEKMLANSELFAQGEYVINSFEWWSGHPPLGKIFIALGMLLFGHDNPFGWRAATIIAGTLVVVLSIILAFILFRSHFIALTAGVLTATDGLLITMSRVSYLDIFLTLMLLFSFIFFVLYFKDKKLTNFYLFAVFAGLAMSVKWSAFFFILTAFLVLFVGLIVRKIRGLNFDFKLLGHYITGGMLSILVYISSWSLWLTFYATQKANNISGLFMELFNAHFYMLTMLESANATQVSNYSYFNEWLTVNNPSFFLVENGIEYYKIIVSMPNIIIWWLATFALVILGALSLLGKMKESVVLLVGVIAALWLPWGLITERVVFQYYAVVFAPYLLILLSYAVLKTKHIFSKPLYLIVTVPVIILCLTVSIIIYPLNTGMAIGKDSFIFNFINTWFNMF